MHFLIVMLFFNIFKTFYSCKDIVCNYSVWFWLTFFLLVKGLSLLFVLICCFCVLTYQFSCCDVTEIHAVKIISNSFNSSISFFFLHVHAYIIIYSITKVSWWKGCTVITQPFCISKSNSQFMHAFSFILETFNIGWICSFLGQV